APNLCGISRDTKQEIRAALGRLITGASMGKLSLRQKEEVLLSVLPYFRHKNYLLDNLSAVSGMSVEFVFRLTDIMKGWVENGASVIFLTEDSETGLHNLKTEKKIDVDYDEQELWTDIVRSMQGLGLGKTDGPGGV
ncbi:MAG: hypothetical protein GY950_34140, partial [bacterium]|nr:hypothetical protein [bacterium]